MGYGNGSRLIKEIYQSVIPQIVLRGLTGFMRVKLGDIFLIQLKNGKHSYAQVTTSPLMIFYNYFGTKKLSLQEITQLPIAFKIFVYKDVLKSGRWERLGSMSLSPEDLIIPYMFKQDLIAGQLSIYHDDFSETDWERPSNLRECIPLECAAVWDDLHVEERLNDLADNKPNKWGGEFEIDRKILHRSR